MIAAFIVLSAGLCRTAVADSSAVSPAIAVAPQYDTTHAYVPPEDFDRFVESLVGTFGGKAAAQGVFTVTPTPSKTKSQFVLTPVGTFSVFGFETPIPYPFGAERTGYLVTNIDDAVRAAKAHGADVIVAPFDDPIGKDAVIQWPGGVNMQLYWHKTPPSFAPLATIPENRVYVSPLKADEFVRDFLGFAHGSVTSDIADAPGAEIGRPESTYRRVRIDSPFGRMTVIVTEGFLPYPYGREYTGYEVSDFTSTFAKAQTAGSKVLAGPYTVGGRVAAMVEFPGGYIAEIHAAVR